MSKPVITVENLSKAYRIGLKEEVPDTLMSAMTGFMKAPLKKFHELRKLDTFRHSGDSEDIYWALKDVSFEVQEGEVLGVIGRNGAGKSTLLKILSRITEPTSGRAVIRGRVSSLLEVGTGFHPELSGRENVYLNGTILGMTKREIDRKFDEIVDFSGVEKFLDTPIKRYSSGMKVRLAFAVAAHLEPEILIIDEVLAVGDAEFQKKCMGKMQDVAKGGRTVLFVSHNMPAVTALCSRGVVLDRGVCINDTTAFDAVAVYRRCATKTDTNDLGSARHMASKNGILVNSSHIHADGDDICIHVCFDVDRRMPILGIGCRLRTDHDVVVGLSGAIHSGAYVANVEGQTVIEVRCKSLLSVLNGGRYVVDLWLSLPGQEKLIEIDSAGEFEVMPKDPTNTGHGLTAQLHGPLMLPVACRIHSSSPLS